MFKLFSHMRHNKVSVGAALAGMHYSLEALIGGARRTMMDVLLDWEETCDRLASLAAESCRSAEALEVRRLKFAPPVAAGKVLCAGGNYPDHQREMRSPGGVNLHPEPFVFMKAPQALIGAGEAIRLPNPVSAKKIDWEGELAVIIGKRASEVTVADADSCIAGYTIMNDVTARDRAVRRDVPFGIDWLASKSFDTFGPIGPYLVPKAFVSRPNELSIRTWVDDVLHQDGNTRDLIVGIPELIAYLSRILTLHPGDVIATGTPSGVGVAKDVFLESGQRVTVEVEGLGRLISPVV